MILLELFPARLGVLGVDMKRVAARRFDFHVGRLVHGVASIVIRLAGQPCAAAGVRRPRTMRFFFPHISQIPSPSNKKIRIA
jgi:hypothetical protein